MTYNPGIMEISASRVLHTLPENIPRALVVMLVVALFSLLAACNESGSTPQNQNNLSAAAARGATQYTNLGCDKCHGSDGKGMGENPALTDPATVVDLKTMIEYNMPPQNPGSCTGTCATDIAQFIYETMTVKSNEPVPTGAELYVDLGCVTCHGANGKGTGTTPPLTDPTTVAQLIKTIATTMPPTAIGSCSGMCATLLAQYIYSNFTDKTKPAPAATGASLFVDRGCAICHGADGKGVAPNPPLTKASNPAQLAGVIATTMPPSAVGSCTGSCATLIAEYIYDKFSDKSVPVVTITDPLNGLPIGAAQMTALCARLATQNVNDRVRTAFCGATPRTITSLTQLQTALGLNFASPNLTGRGNNGQGGNPGFAISGHSSSLVLRSVSAINPRAILFTPPTGNPVPGFVTLGFVRGDQFAEIIAHNPTTGVLDFYLARFTQACNTTNSCTPGNLLTPAVESNWLTFQIYDETDLKNTIVDCTQCHQPGGPATTRFLRMQELANPWNHWFRDNRVGGQALIADYQAAHGTTEAYAGIPGALINASDPARLEDVIRQNGFGAQNGVFNSGNIEAQINATAGQPQNNDTPGTSTAWNTIFNRAVLGQIIPVPYHDIKVTESATLRTFTTAYQNFRANPATAATLPDLRNVFKTSRLFEIAGIAARPGLDGPGIITEMCTQCHNSRLDQTITRSRFNVNLTAMSNLVGGVLTGAARDTEIGVAISRLSLPSEDVRKMPPETLKSLSATEINTVVTYLCTQVAAPIPQCAGR